MVGVLSSGSLRNLLNVLLGIALRHDLLLLIFLRKRGICIV